MAGGFVTYNLGDRVEVTPPIEKKDDNKDKGETDDLFDRIKEEGSSSDEEEEEEASVQSIDPTKAVKYIPQTIARVPFKGEIIGIKRYDDI